MTYPTPTHTSTGAIDAHRARTVATRLRALEAAGHRLTLGQRWVLECCERRVQFVESLNAGKEAAQ